MKALGIFIISEHNIFKAHNMDANIKVVEQFTILHVWGARHGWILAFLLTSAKRQAMGMVICLKAQYVWCYIAVF